MPDRCTAESLAKATNVAFEKLRQCAGHLDVVRREYETAAGLDKDSHLNPFDLHYEMERLIDKAREEAARRLIRRFNAMLVPNIPIDPDQLLRDLDFQRTEFDARIILRHVRGNYVKNAKRKSCECILRQARRLLPHPGWKEELTLERILKKNTIVLHKYVSSYNWGCSFQHGETCDALQKLVRIVLEDADPVTVDTGVSPVSEIQHARKGKELFDPIKFNTGWIQKIKFHKNGKMLVTMKAATAARRIAELLLEKTNTA